jgi:hypothetical protein
MKEPSEKPKLFPSEFILRIDTQAIQIISQGLELVSIPNVVFREIVKKLNDQIEQQIQDFNKS